MTSVRHHGRENQTHRLPAVGGILARTGVVHARNQGGLTVSAEATPQASQGIRGSQISDESAPGTRLLILGTSRRTDCCCGMEDIAMPLFYLPIIIFEAMLEANANKREADESTVIE
jgi:hypothetical protein